MDQTFISEEPKRPNLINIPMQGENAPQEAFRVRELFKEYFNSPAGSVAWLNEIV